MISLVQTEHKRIDRNSPVIKPLAIFLPLSVSVPDMVWNNRQHAELADLDKVGLPGGLGWPGTMRIGTGAQLLGQWFRPLQGHCVLALFQMNVAVC